MNATDASPTTKRKLDGIRRRWGRLSKPRKVIGAVSGAVVSAATIVGGVEWTADAVGFTPPSEFVYELLHQPSNSELVWVTAGVRHDQSNWVQKATIYGGLDPHFDVQINYKNISGKDLSDVVISLDPIGRAIPIDGTAMMIDNGNPLGISIDNDILLPHGLNLVSPQQNTDVYVRVSYRLSSANLPCGRNTMSFRARVRTPAVDHDKPIDSNEALVVYYNECLPGTADSQLVPAPLPGAEHPATP